MTEQFGIAKTIETAPRSEPFHSIDHLETNSSIGLSFRDLNLRPFGHIDIFVPERTVPGVDSQMHVVPWIGFLLIIAPYIGTGVCET